MTVKKLELLLQHHEGITAALRTTLALLRGDAMERKATRGPAVLQAALQLDAARTKTNDGTHTRMVKARRERTAALLARFDLHKPQTIQTGRTAGVLVQHGFLKKTRGGYVRTSKQFTP
jgi:hypothetical protein